MITCKVCLINKDKSEFRLRKSKNREPYHLSTCKECERHKDRERYRLNPELYKEKSKRCRVKSDKVTKIKLTKKEYYELTKNKPINIITRSVRRRLKKYLNKFKVGKNNKTFDHIGCTPNELKQHIESLFSDGMTWVNYGLYGWHIDHIVPLSSANTLDEMLKLNHYTNLQPLWWYDNLSKNKKIL